MYRHGHQGLLSLQFLAGLAKSSTMKDSYQRPWRTSLPVRGEHRKGRAQGGPAAVGRGLALCWAPLGALAARDQSLLRVAFPHQVGKYWCFPGVKLGGVGWRVSEGPEPLQAILWGSESLLWPDLPCSPMVGQMPRSFAAGFVLASCSQPTPNHGLETTGKDGCWMVDPCCREELLPQICF